MKVIIRLAEHLGDKADQRGTAAEIEQRTGIERHTVAALLHNEAKYVSLEALGKLCEYLIQSCGADPRTLPGALLGRMPEDFWTMLAGCEQLNVCIGTRQSKQWGPPADYVMAKDSRLQGVLMSTIWRAGAEPARATAGAGTGGAPEKKAAAKGAGEGHRVPEFYLLRGPSRKGEAEDPGETWTAICARARKLYKQWQGRPRIAVIALGSIKVNPMVELMFSDAFSVAAFQEEHATRAKDRKCPIWFRFREEDPKPPSCCGGLQLADGEESGAPGLYYEQDDGSWNVCTVDHVNDAAFLFYCHRPGSGHVEVACGGFSSRATDYLTEDIHSIVADLGEPQWEAKGVRIGMYVVRFTVQPHGRKRPDGEDPFKSELVPLSRKVLARRLGER